MNQARPAYQARRMLYAALWASPVRSLLVRVPLVRRIYDGWVRTHPYDLAHGVDTSGSVSTAEYAPDAAMAAQIIHYAGSQPSIVRRCLASLPDCERYVLVDLGCGKGRPLLVASEFPFRRLIGIEISQPLAEVARHNARAIADKYPRRTPIEIQVGDASAVAAPAERVVIFMYHPFGRDLVSTLITSLEQQLAHGLQHAFLVYYNPVHGDAIDRSAHFVRWRAATIPYADDELGFGPDLSDTVVIWQTAPGRYAAEHDADRPIVVHAQRAKADLAASR